MNLITQPLFKCSMQISKSFAFLNNLTKILRMSEKSKTLPIILLNELTKSLISEIVFNFSTSFKMLYAKLK